MQIFRQKSSIHPKEKDYSFRILIYIARLVVAMEKWDPVTEGKPTEAAIRQKMNKLGCINMDRYVYPIGCYFSEHSHSWDKLDSVVSGRLRIVMESVTYDLGPGDMLHIPRGALHTAEVIGAESCISFDGSMASQ